MSNEWDLTGDDIETGVGDGPKPLRDAYKKQVDANRELRERLEKLEAINTRNAAADLIEAAGAKRSIAKHYTGAADPESVSTWLNDFKDAFGVQTSTTSTPDPALPVETQAQYERMNQAGHGGESTGNLQAAAGDLSSANDLNSLLAAMQKLQGGATS